MIRKLRAGFTIVELLVVVAVILILATIVAILYEGVQERANDTKLRDASVKVASAIQLFAAKYEHFPQGGSGATGAISGSECADGVNGWFAKGAYGASGCTVEDTLAASGYLPANFSADLPKNTLYTLGSGSSAAIMVYKRTVSGKDKVMVFHAMESPSDSDTAKFNTELTKCGYTTTPGSVAPRDTYGMRSGVCADL